MSDRVKSNSEEQYILRLEDKWKWQSEQVKNYCQEEIYLTLEEQHTELEFNKKN